MLINEAVDWHMQVEGELVTVQSKVWGVRMRWWVWVWQRPLAVQYQKTQIPINNVTRQAVLSIGGGSLFIILYSFFRGHGLLNRFGGNHA